VPLSATVPDASSRCPPAVCVSVVLRDALRRVALLGGRDGMARSLGSLHAGAVTRFLSTAGSLRGVVSRVIPTARVHPLNGGFAVSRDGSTLLVAGSMDGTNAIHVFRVADGKRLRVVGKTGRGPLEFNHPMQVYIAPDDFVFVADFDNERVQVLTPTLDFHGFVGEGKLRTPEGVCANGDVVVVAESRVHRICVFNRADGALLRRFGGPGTRSGALYLPGPLCFTHRGQHVAVTEFSITASRVSVFTVDGNFIRHVGVGVLKHPRGVACAVGDELVVADGDNRRVVVFGAAGEVLATMRGSCYGGVAVHDGAVFAHGGDWKSPCTVFT
jgi:DNA-binding beta-propeller fold protein YncE